MKTFDENRGSSVTTPAANRDAHTIKTTMSGSTYVLDGSTFALGTLEWKNVLGYHITVSHLCSGTMFYFLNQLL